jgi:hypothetical protein
MSYIGIITEELFVGYFLECEVKSLMKYCASLWIYTLKCIKWKW